MRIGTGSYGTGGGIITIEGHNYPPFIIGASLNVIIDSIPWNWFEENLFFQKIKVEGKFFSFEKVSENIKQETEPEHPAGCSHYIS